MRWMQFRIERGQIIWFLWRDKNWIAQVWWMSISSGNFLGELINVPQPDSQNPNDTLKIMREFLREEAALQGHYISSDAGQGGEPFLFHIG
jgi:hypothetical protein